MVQLVDSDEFQSFDRIVFDTAPTGHTLRLLDLPQFLDVSIGKVLRLRKRVAGVTSAVAKFLGKGEDSSLAQTEKALEKLEELQKRLAKVALLIRWYICMCI